MTFSSHCSKEDVASSHTSGKFRALLNRAVCMEHLEDKPNRLNSFTHMEQNKDVTFGGHQNVLPNFTRNNLGQQDKNPNHFLGGGYTVMSARPENHFSHSCR